MHLEALTSDTRALWPRLKAFPEYVLAGGTALALQIGHRISADFDFFSRHEIPAALLAAVERAFGPAAVTILLNTPEQLTVLVKGVKVTFVTYRFPALDLPIEFEGIRLLSIRDIAAAKAYVLGRRATLKDYADLYFIISEKHCSLGEIIRLAGETYGDAFDPRLFLEQLVYLKDVSAEPMQFLKPAVSKAAIETFFEREVARVEL